MSNTELRDELKQSVISNTYFFFISFWRHRSIDGRLFSSPMTEGEKITLIQLFKLIKFLLFFLNPLFLSFFSIFLTPIAPETHTDKGKRKRELVIESLTRNRIFQFSTHQINLRSFRSLTLFFFNLFLFFFSYFSCLPFIISFFYCTSTSTSFHLNYQPKWFTYIFLLYHFSAIFSTQ